VWRRLTWEQFARATKFLAAIAWATLELWQWGARGEALAFITSVIGLSEAGQLYLRLRSEEQRGSSPIENSSPPSLSASDSSSPGS
jgi:hypothetical protein